MLYMELTPLYLCLPHMPEVGVSEGCLLQDHSSVKSVILVNQN